MILNSICILIIACGLIFFFGAVVGLVRFPDFYARMHAAGKGDTLSTMLILAGLAAHVFHDGFTLAHFLVAAKILAICAFIMLTSPTSTHALMQAAFDEGVEPHKGSTNGDDKPEAKS